MMTTPAGASEGPIPPWRRLGRGIARAFRRDIALGEPGGGAARFYADAVGAFIEALRIRSVVEFGDGDFRVRGAAARAGARYIGLDPSGAVVARNRARHAGRKVRFLVGDPRADPLPDGELCLVGGLFRHLTNGEIRLMLLRLRKYEYVIFDDYQPPAGTFVPNLDKPPGGSTRLARRSALDLRRPPFNVRHVGSFLGLPSDNPVFDPGERRCSFLICRDHQTPWLDPAYLD